MLFFGLFFSSHVFVNRQISFFTVVGLLVHIYTFIYKSDRMSSYFLFTSRQLEMFPCTRFLSSLLFSSSFSCQCTSKINDARLNISFSAAIDRLAFHTTSSFFVSIVFLWSLMCCCISVAHLLFVHHQLSTSEHAVVPVRCLFVFLDGYAAKNICLSMTLSDCQFFLFPCVYNTM